MFMGLFSQFEKKRPYPSAKWGIGEITPQYFILWKEWLIL